MMPEGREEFNGILEPFDRVAGVCVDVFEDSKIGLLDPRGVGSGFVLAKMTRLLS
jgi:hypothetical protein